MMRAADRKHRADSDGGRRLRAVERIVLSGGPLGLMQSAFDVRRRLPSPPSYVCTDMRSHVSYLQYALPYVHERKQFGEPVGSFQLMQGKIADMYTQVSAGRAYLYSVARGSSASFPLRSGVAADPNLFCMGVPIAQLAMPARFPAG